MDRTEPAEPIDKIEPAEPMDRIEPAEPIDRREPVDPIDRSEPFALGLPIGPGSLIRGRPFNQGPRLVSDRDHAARAR